jgi:hypothetical protein
MLTTAGDRSSSFAGAQAGSSVIGFQGGVTGEHDAGSKAYSRLVAVRERRRAATTATDRRTLRSCSWGS